MRSEIPFQADTRYGLLTYPLSHNLGDEIQSIAARRWLPRTDLFVDRDALDRDPDPGAERVAMILNGWFMQAPRHWPPHPKIDPLILSLHLSQDRPAGPRAFWSRTPARRMLGRGGIAYLREHGPIGARDEATLALLDQAGVPAYLSGCLTLTLPRADAAAREPRIVACDLPEPALAALRARTRTPVEAVTHIDTVLRGTAARMARAEQLLDLYARAQAVVTSRIHCALPCLAMGTPVLFVTEWPGHYRLEPAMRLARSATLAAFLAGDHDFDPDDPPANPDAYLPLREALERRCGGDPRLAADQPV